MVAINHHGAGSPFKKVEEKRVDRDGHCVWWGLVWEGGGGAKKLRGCAHSYDIFKYIQD